MGLSHTAYAKHRKARGLPGQTTPAVRAAVNSGRIPTLPDGSIDALVADAAWAANTSETNGGSRPGAGRKRRDDVTAEVTLERVAAAEEVVRKVMAAHGSPLDPDAPVQLGHARKVDELLKAEQRALEIERLRGESVPKRGMERALETWSREQRELLQAVPGAECDAIAEALAQDPGTRTAKRELERIVRVVCARLAERAFEFAGEARR
jgi:hypothetical protein